MEGIDNPNLRGHYRMVAVLAAGFLVSMAVIAAVAPLLVGQTVPSDIGFVKGMALAAAVVLYIVVRGVRDRMLAGSGLASMIDQVMIPGQRYRTMVRAVLVTFAFSEAVALFGVGLFLLTGQLADLYTFVGLGALFIVLYFPGYGRWAHWFAYRNHLR